MRQAYKKRKIKYPPQFNRFRPTGIPARFLEKINLTIDEYEALRLADYLGMEHADAAEKMHISAVLLEGKNNHWSV